MCNISGASWTKLHNFFTCTRLSQEYEDNIEQDFYLGNVVPRVLKRHWRGSLPVEYCLEPLGQHKTKFLTVKCCPKCIKITLNRIVFLCNALWSLSDNIALSFCPCNFLPRVLRQHWTRFLAVQCCLGPPGQHSTKLLPVQIYPKSIKTIFNRIFFYAMLPGAFWATLHKVFTCAMLSQGY